MGSGIKKPLCHYPFTQMLLQPTGFVSPCCYLQETTIGNLKNQPLLEIWNGEPLQNLRREFLEGQHSTCAKNMREIQCHQSSERHLNDPVEYTVVKSQHPVRLDVRLNGKCNLQCIMCDVWQQPNGVFDKTDFWIKGPTEIFPYLKGLDVLGGEPFIQKDTFKLINLVSGSNPDCRWSFVTNGQYEFNDHLSKYLDKIKIDWIQVSLDSLNSENYARIRKNGILKKTLKSIEALAAYNQQRSESGNEFFLKISMCVQITNWQEVPEFLEFCRQINAGPILQFLYTPHELSLLATNRAYRKEVLRSFLSVEQNYWPYLAPIRAPLIESLKQLSPDSPQYNP
jgi:MoaA/NifB/PqqE/SkfB family radical SAM enzyme